MEGLAQQMAGSAPQQADMKMLEQIMQMLLEGVDPEQLVQQGIPPEVIMAAIDMLEQQLAQEGQQQAAQAAPAGLAQSAMMGKM